MKLNLFIYHFLSPCITSKLPLLQKLQQDHYLQLNQYIITFIKNNFTVMEFFKSKLDFISLLYLGGQSTKLTSNY